MGEVMGVGWIIGEEILYTKDNNQKIVRHEQCSALNDACVLQVSFETLSKMIIAKSVIGGGGNLKLDYELLCSFMRKNYEVKH
jgi:hypothetical protein